MRTVATWVGRGLGAVVTLALAAVIVLGLFGLGFSGGIGDNYVELVSPDAPRPFDLVVTGFDGDAVTLEGGSVDRLSRDGVWGLDYPNGYGQLTTVESTTESAVTRTFMLADGEAPPVGTVARLDPAAWRGGPDAAGLSWRDVSYTTELGPYPSWLVGGPSDTWLIVVHHRADSLDQGLRMAAIAEQAGVQTLVASYRHDRDAPAGPRSKYEWGASEWRDLEGAVQYAVDNGAETVVAAGYGMGGSIVLSFLEESANAGLVDAVILDSPIIDLDATVEHDLAQDELGSVFALPTAINRSARLIAGWRFSLDWTELDRSDTPPGVPTLIFHGDADLVTPITQSEAYAATWSNQVELVVARGAGFGEAWNVDPDAYAAAVARFIAEL